MIYVPTVLFFIAIILQTYATIVAMRVYKYVLWPKPWLAFTLALGFTTIIFSSELYFHFSHKENIPVIEGLLAITIAALMAYHVGYSAPSIRMQNRRLKKRTEQKNKAEHRLQLINDFSNHLMQLNTAEDLIWYVAEKIVEQVEFLDCVIYLYDSDKKILIQSAAIGPKNPIRREIDNKIEIPMGEGITGFVAKNKEGIIVDNVLEDDRYIFDLDFTGSEICVPIVHEDRVFGVIDCEHTDIAFFNEQHLELLNTVASILATRLAQWESMEKLQETKKSLLEAQAISHHGNWIWDIKSNKIKWSDEIFRIFGYEPQSFEPTYNIFLSAIPSEHRDRVNNLVNSMLDQKNTNPYNADHPIILPDGSTRFVNEQGVMHFNKDGEPISMSGTIQDITERIFAEKASSETEEKLRQSQKMEAVGQLTGGISHDFNNLLAIILGNLQLLEMDINSGKHIEKNHLQDTIIECVKAGKKGAELTHKLLAFSRKQVLSSETLIANNIVIGMEGLLKRTIGENIELEIDLADNLWSVETDASQFENALLNMSINSRDVMQSGGKLTIKTRNINVKSDFVKLHPEFKAGEYVLLEVADTGYGMNAETLDKVFEPFFTTKAVGKGSGLGLSMVYGFVKQSGGQVLIVSEVGVGTSIKIYLPRSISEETQTEDTEQKQNAAEGSETILLVEDEDGVRKVFDRLLKQLGYRVFEAKDGSEAVEVMKNIDKIDLLLSDVVLPGKMSGPDIRVIAKEHSPDLRVLFVTGYTDDNYILQGIKDKNINILSKPFEPIELSIEIRRILDE